MYYSYDVNDVHIVSLNSEVLFDDIFDQDYIDTLITWLKEDLQSNTKTWTLVYMHRPIYCSKVKGKDCNKDSEKLRVLLEDIFMNNHVDLVLTAHRHNYER
jgi:hypothetical protein